jgi:hypothetical protein
MASLEKPKSVLVHLVPRDIPQTGLFYVGSTQTVSVPGCLERHFAECPNTGTTANFRDIKRCVHVCVLEEDDYFVVKVLLVVFLIYGRHFNYGWSFSFIKKMTFVVNVK